MLHLYLGSLFAPALLVLASSGAWQVFRWNDAKKDGSYTPAPIIRTLSAVHKDQVLPGVKRQDGLAMQWFTLGASMGLILTTCLGIVMAYRVTRRPVVVTLCLLAGILAPTALLTSYTKAASARPAEEGREKLESMKPAGAVKTAPTPAWTPKP